MYCFVYVYFDCENLSVGLKFVERVYFFVCVYFVIGWKVFWVNCVMMMRIVGLDKVESDLILNYLYDVYEKNVDI